MNQRRFVTQTTLVLALLLVLAGSALAVQTYGGIYAETCLVCHEDNTGVGNAHHILSVVDNIDCFVCHALVWNPATQANDLPFRDEGCFLRCHAQTLAKLDGPFIRVIPSDPYDNLDYFPSLLPNVKRKMADAHHGNYGAPAAQTQCGRCHAMVWDPQINAVVTAPVAGSAGTAGDVNNLLIVLAPDQLVYDARPGETITLSAGLSEGNGISFTWLLRVGSTSAAGQVLGRAAELSYKISPWTTRNTTNFLELQLTDAEGRFVKKYVAVNIH